MSYSLQRRRGYLSMSMYAWPRMLDLAMAYGWKPVGTNGPYGWYVGNHGQRVSARDARNLAAALERAYPDMPHPDAVAAKFRNGGKLTRGTLVDEFSPPWSRELVRKCAEFCRKGAFEIW